MMQTAIGSWFLCIKKLKVCVPPAIRTDQILMRLKPTITTFYITSSDFPRLLPTFEVVVLLKENDLIIVLTSFSS